MFAASKTASVSGGYQISRSLRFNSADSAYLNRTPASATNQKTWTWSGWVKRSALRANLSDPATLFNAGGNGFNARFSYANPDQLEFYNYSGAAFQLNLATTAVYRDVSAWYHIVFALDTTQATDTNRFKVYVNGTQVTAFSTATYPSQNSDMLVNGTSVHALGVLNGIGGYYSGYMTEINFIDGSQLTPSSFGETNAQTGVWQPKAYSGSYGTNGFYLNFSDNSNTTAATLGKDYSGNGNNWTPNNFSVTAGAGNDSLVDSPTSYGTDTGVGGTVRGNYSTLNPLDKGADITVVNGNLDVVASTGWRGVRATFGMSSSKWYCEYTPTSGTYHIVSISTQLSSGRYIDDAYGWGYQWDGTKVTNGSSSSYGASWGVGDIIGIAFDADAGTLTFYKNGTSQGTAFTGLTSGPYLVGIGVYPSATGTYNFGQRPFAYTAPSGYKALCTQNLPTPTIGATSTTLANKYFDVSTWSGTGSNISVTNSGSFQPDWVWAKCRSNAGTNNILEDAVRGVSYWLSSDSTSSESGLGSPGPITAFNSNGFSGDTSISGSGRTYVGWQWKANGSGSTNTSGSITSTVSANTTSGFSVVTYTNATSGTVGHGLGVAPAMVIYKDRTNVTNWIVLHQSLANMSSSFLVLNLTNAVATLGTALGGNPTSSVIYTNTSIIQNGAASVAYCFAEISGYSKFGSYTGNGSSDGAFVYTGFRPAYVLIKRTTSAYDWWILDAARGTINAVKGRLYANASDAESTTYPYLDFLSNGFKLRDADGGLNASGEPYIYACFAQNPFKYSLAR